MSWLNSLNAKFGVIVAVLAILTIGLISNNYFADRSFVGQSAEMNKFGIGRAYAVEIISLLDKLSGDQGEHNSADRARLRKIINLMNERYDALLNGVPSEGISAVTNPETLKLLRESKATWTKEIEPLMQSILNASSREQVLELIASLSEDMKGLSTNLDASVEAETQALRVEVEHQKELQLMFLGVVIIIFCLILAIIRRITARMRLLMTAANQIAGGDLSQRVKIAGSDEVAVLGEAFNTMADSLDELLTAIGETTGNLTSASTELLAGTTQQSASAQEQAASVAETVTT